MGYVEQKQKHMSEINAFPMFFAFTEQDLEEGLGKLNAKPSEVYSIPFGGFIRKTDKLSFFNLLQRHDQEMKKSFEDDNFLIDAIEYELSNHEFCYSQDPQYTLNALGISLEDERVNNCFLLAKRNYFHGMKGGW